MPSLRTFIAKISHPQLVSEFLKRHGADLGADASGLDDKQLLEVAEAAIDQASATTKDIIAKEIERISKMADEAGEAALDMLPVSDGRAELARYAAALHAFLHEADTFRHAEEIVLTDGKRGTARQWTAFAARKDLDLARDEAALEAFKQEMRAFFSTRNVHVDIFDRTRFETADIDGEIADRTASLVQITVYREDRPDTELAFASDGTLGTQTRRKVLEAALTYERATGVIECVGRQRGTREEMARMLAVTLLGCDPTFEPVRMRAYDLTVLRQRITFESEPVHQIEQVHVTMLRLTPHDAPGEQVTLECEPDKHRDIWSTTEARLGAEALLSDYQINQARILIRYRAGGNRRLRSLPIVITHPSSSNLREQREIERVISSKYLPRWGLVAPA